MAIIVFYSILLPSRCCSSTHSFLWSCMDCHCWKKSLVNVTISGLLDLPFCVKMWNCRTLGDWGFRNLEFFCKGTISSDQLEQVLSCVKPRKGLISLVTAPDYILLQLNRELVYGTIWTLSSNVWVPQSCLIKRWDLPQVESVSTQPPVNVAKALILKIKC